MEVKTVEVKSNKYVSADMIVFDNEDSCKNHESKLDLGYINKQPWLKFLELDHTDDKTVYTDKEGNRYKLFGKFLNKYTGILYLTNDRAYNAIHGWGSWLTADCKYNDLILGDIKFKAIYEFK